MSSQSPHGSNQHYVPRSYLARFSGADEKVAVHRLNRPLKRIHPLRVGKERHYNSIPGPDGKMDTKPEGVITEYIDTPTHRVFERLEAGEQITPEEHVQLALFIAFQYFRSPPRKREILKVFDRQLSDTLEGLVLDDANYRQWLEASHAPLSKAQAKELQDIVRAGEMNVRASNAPWLDYAFSRAKHIAPRLVNERGWTLLYAHKNHEFITSDDPVTHYHLAGAQDYSDVTVWFQPGVMTVFPVSPSRAVLIGSRMGRRSLEASPRQARDVNRVTVLGSGRMVFSRKSEPWIQTILRKRNGNPEGTEQSH